jgi:chromatin remodeling complex protein RSC6
MSANASSESIKMSAAAVKSTKKSTKTETAAPAPVAAAPVAAAPAKEVKAPKAKEVKAAEKPAAAPAAVAAAAVVAAPVAAPAAAPASPVEEEDLGAQLQKSIASLHEQLAALKTAAATAATALKTIEKQAARVAKKAIRRRKQRKVDGAPPKECYFTKPLRITDELCSFLGKAKGTEMTRAEVTKGVIAYAKSHNLMEKQNIKADATLRKLLTINETDKLNILNLQTYVNRHYVKATPVAN